MLRGLDISDMLIIDRLELSFQPGLNVLTGETGAGKSILLDSLGFVLGWRGRADLVRQGAAQGEVTACFDLGPDHPARAVLEDAGLPVHPFEAIVGGTPAQNAADFKALLAGKASAYRDAVLLNAAAALVVADAASGLKEGVEMAATSIDSGAAAQKIEAVAKITQAA